MAQPETPAVAPERLMTEVEVSITDPHLNPMGAKGGFGSGT